MADLDRARNQPEEQLWDQIDDVHAGMLGVEGSGQHMQPMAPQPDRDNKKIWFFTRRDSDLVSTLGQSAKAHFCIIGDDHDYHACLAGSLRRSTDRRRIERFWNPVVAAWFDGGQDDPDLVLLEFDLSDAAVWVSSSNPLRFGWQIVKANLTSDEPDLGVQTRITF